MSSGIVTAGCCCGPCTTCCSWWSASPAGPVDIVLTYYQNQTLEIGPGGQFMQLGYTAWTITATLTKSGSCCDYNTCGPTYANLTRYTADVCEVSATRVSNIYTYGFPRRSCREEDVAACLGLPNCYCTIDPKGCNQIVVGGITPPPLYTGGNTYDGLLNCTVPCTNFNYPYSGLYPAGYQLADPCRGWNCKKCNFIQGLGDCECECKTVPELLWKKMYEETHNYTATVFGTGTGPGACAYGGKPDQAGANAVITVYCGPNPCGGTCLVPRLLFTPRDQALVSNVRIYDATMNPCCPNGYCPGQRPYPSSIPWGSCYSTTTTVTPHCLPEFSLVGKGTSFNSATFSNPIPASTFDITLGFGIQTGTVEWGMGTNVTNANACETVDKTAVCTKYSWDHSTELNPSGSPYFPVYCGNERLSPLGNNKGCDTNASRCYGPSWNERYCMATRSLTATVT